MFIIIIGMILIVACSNSDNNKEKSANNNGEISNNTAESEVTIKLAHVASEEVAVHHSAVRFAELAKEKSNGEINVEIYSNASLGGNREILESLQSGSL